jgi:DEAD/DEAH box helicase domain-containing protein
MNQVYFDLETQKSAEEVGGWGNKKAMRFSFGVTYSTRDQCFRPYEEEDIPALVKELSEADRVIGFNILGFDYPVLSGYTDFDFSRIPTLDLLADLHSIMGFRVGLNSVAQATLQAKKSADGLAALRWFREGAFAQIAIYCRQDVAVTRDLHRFGCENKYVCYLNSAGQPVKVQVNW